MQLHFAKCIARFWNGLRSEDYRHRSQSVAKDDAKLMLRGNTRC